MFNYSSEKKKYIIRNTYGYSHVLLTRFGIGVFDERWLEFRLRVFESLTLPSVLSQKSEKVVWFLFVDSDAPEKFITHLLSLVGKYNFIKVMSVDFYFEYFDISKSICAEILHNNGSVIVSKIDDDDLLHKDFFRVLYNESDLDDNCVCTFPVGYEFLLQERVLLRCKRPFLTHNTHFVLTDESLLDLIKVGHHKIERYCVEKDVKVKFFPYKEPLYLYTRHKQSDSNYASVKKEIMGNKESRVITTKAYEVFSIDREKYLRVREKNKESLSSPKQKTWRMNLDLNQKAEDLHKELSGIKKRIVLNGSNVFK